MTRLDDFLDKHRKLDSIVLRYYARRNQVRNIPSVIRARRTWKPGTFYLDHGYTPCILEQLFLDDELHGVSLVDGSQKMGCSIYHCGPVQVTRKEAFEAARKIRESQSDVEEGDYVGVSRQEIRHEWFAGRVSCDRDGYIVTVEETNDDTERNYPMPIIGAEFRIHPEGPMKFNGNVERRDEIWKYDE